MSGREAADRYLSEDFGKTYLFYPLFILSIVKAGDSWEIIQAQGLGLEAWGIAGHISTDFLTIQQLKEAHPMTGVIMAEFKNRKGESMGTGSLFQYKLLKDWDKVVEEAGGKAEEFN